MALTTPRSPAVFVDKDGTLVDNVPYNVDPERIRLAPGVAAGARELIAAGFRLVVISNQSGVARGYFEEGVLRDVERRIRDLLDDVDVSPLAFYWCPHHPAGRIERYAVACGCRKPQPGLILQAAQEHDLDLTRSWLVGDILDDVEAGRRAGVRPILIDNGHETEWVLTPARTPDAVVPDFGEAAKWIVHTIEEPSS